MSQTFSETWENYETVQKSLRKMKLKNNNRVIPKTTHNAFRTWIIRYTEYAGMNPDELITEALNDVDRAEERLGDFFGEIITEKLFWDNHKLSFNSARTGVYGVLRGFFTKNKVNTHAWNSPDPRLPKVDSIDGNNPMFTITKDHDLDLNRDILRRFLKTLSNRDEVIAYCILTSGVDVSDILSLNVADVIDQKQDRIFLQFQRSKTGEQGKTFFSKEATTKLNKYLEGLKFTSQEDPLFPTVHGTRLQGFELSHIFRRAQKRIGIECKDRTLSPLRAKRLRKIFKTAGTRAGLEEDVLKTFMGQKSAESKKYLGKSREELEFYYERIEPFLTMIPSTKPIEEKLKRKDVEIQRLRELIDAQKIDAQLVEKLVANPNFMSELSEAIAKEIK